MARKTIKLGILTLGAAVFMFYSITLSRGAGPQLFVTWRAATYTPADYQGKALPTWNSLVTISFELLSNGKPVDLSKQTVYWYLSDSLLKGGVGLQTLSLVTPQNSQDTLSLKVEIPNFGGNMLDKDINIPIVAPRAVVNAPYPEGKFSVTSAEVQALPYFFNVQDPLALSYDWNVNGATPPGAEDPTVLTTTINSDAPSGANLNIILFIKNPKNDSETAASNINLTYIK
jgi:hypothetical protein